MCVLILSTTFREMFSILRRTQQDIIINVHSLHIKCPLFLWEFNETWISPTDFPKILKYQILWKSAQWEPSCLMRSGSRIDRRRDMTKLKVAFRNFANALEKHYYWADNSFTWEILSLNLECSGPNTNIFNSNYLFYLKTSRVILITVWNVLMIFICAVPCIFSIIGYVRLRTYFATQTLEFLLKPAIPYWMY